MTAATSRSSVWLTTAVTLVCNLHSLTMAVPLGEWAYPLQKQQPHRHLMASYQSPPDSLGSSFAAAVAFNKATQAIHITGTTYGSVWDEDWDGDSSACFYAVLAMNNNDQLITAHRSVLGEAGIDQGCQNILIDGARVFLAGQTVSGGLLEQWEQRNNFGMETEFGMMLDLQYSNQQSPAETPQWLGGHLWQGATVVYPIAMAKDGDPDSYLYTVMLEQDSTQRSSKYLADTLKDPTKVFMYGDNYSMRIVASTVDPNPTPSARMGDTKTLLAEKWVEDLAPRPGFSVDSIGGIAKLGQYVFVGGSTAGTGQGFGERDDASGTDLDGFVTRFDATSGASPTSAQTLGGNPTWRAWSYSGSDDKVNGLCVSQLTPEFVYAVGTTSGFIDDRNPDNASVSRAFLAKIRIAGMAPVWVQHIEGSAGAEVEGISCAVTNSGGEVFIAGNVRNGYILESDVTNSYGDSDIFVSKINLADGTSSEDQVMFSRQFGSAGADTLAHRKGLDMAGASGSVVIVGNTVGPMYRDRSNEEGSFSNVFAVVMTNDGSFTQPSGGPAVPPLDVDDSDSSSRAKGLLIFLLIAIAFVGLAMCAQQYCHHKREASTDRGKVLNYLQDFDVEDIDLKHSATGGWHCSYVNDLARGVNVQCNTGSTPDRHFMHEDYYEDTGFDPLNAAASSPTSPESKVLEDSLFVIEDGEEMLTFGNDRSTRTDGLSLGSAYRDTWKSSGKSASRGRKKQDAWGRDII